MMHSAMVKVSKGLAANVGFVHATPANIVAAKLPATTVGNSNPEFDAAYHWPVEKIAVKCKTRAASTVIRRAPVTSPWRAPSIAAMLKNHDATTARKAHRV